VHPSGHEPIRFQVKRQRGASLLLFVVGLLLLAATVFAIRLLGPAKRGALQAEVTAENIAAVQSAILAYVAVNGHIPCPANPAPANDGQSSPLPPSTSCTSPNGVVPWATLGIAPDVALDGWNRRRDVQTSQEKTVKRRQRWPPCKKGKLIGQKPPRSSARG